MPKGLKRYYGQGQLHFVTFSCYRRLPLLGRVQARNHFVKELGRARFYDFSVYSHEKKKEKLEYMHANPVVRGLVKHPKDWPWSSFSFYAKDEKGWWGSMRSTYRCAPHVKKAKSKAASNHPTPSSSQTLP